MNLMIQFIFALIITVFVEFFFAYLFMKKEPAKLFLCIFLINSFTLPIATKIFQYKMLDFFTIEFFVFFIESLLLMPLLGIKYKKALLISLAANSATSAISLLFLVF